MRSLRPGDANVNELSCRRQGPVIRGGRTLSSSWRSVDPDSSAWCCRFNVVVVANRGQQSASASFVDGKPGLRTKLLLSPANAVVLDYARRPIVGNRALLLTEAASGDLFREVREQVRCTSVAGMRTDRTAVVAIRREGRDDRISITGVHRRQITSHDRRRTRIGRG